MFFDWIGREGGWLISWWLISLFGAIAVYPLFFRLMRGLPSRGYPLARTAGILLIGYIFWILNNLGLLRNTPGSTALAWLIVLTIGLVSYATWRDREPIIPWLRKNVPLILTTELVFVVLFVGWATVRALNPSLLGTEHPMDLAFLSASRHSATFPPNDPWMSGYAISYYHFGYILMAMVANLSGVLNGVAFNLAISLIFALAGVGAFGVAYDLVALRVIAARGDQALSRKRVFYGTATATGVLATVMLLFMGNLGPALVEIPYQTRTASPGYLNFFDLRYRPGDLSGCPQSGSLDPTTWNCGGWWWWAYSRVVQDRDLNGSSHEIIDEVPQFSFILADLHPHVMALPFAMLVIGLSLNLVAGKRRLRPWEVLLYTIFVGGMVFLNSWDAVYIGFLFGAEALRRLLSNGTGRYTPEDWRGMLVYGVSFVALTGILYAPFFIGFRSQAGSVLPDVIWPTRFPQYFLFFGIFIVILGGFLMVELNRARDSFNWRFALQAIGVAVGFLVMATIIFTLMATRSDSINSMVMTSVDQSGGLGTVIPQVLLRRLEGLPTEGLLIVGLFLVIGRLFAREPISEAGTPMQTRQVITYSTSTGFALLLIAAGAVLTLLPDFIYLQDGFGNRINMIFKIYYQGWALWSIAGAFAVWSVLSQLEAETVLTRGRVVFGGVAAAMIGLGLVFPAAAIPSRALAEGEHLNGVNPPLTLDGGPSLVGPDDYKVVQCLADKSKSDHDVVAEATRNGLAYTDQFGRVSALTGIPTLLGWDNHERQWRGNTFDEAVTYRDTSGRPIDTRIDAIARLYNTTDWAVATDVVRRYGITYIYVGPTERNETIVDPSDTIGQRRKPLFDPAGIAKFSTLKPVCSSGDSAVYSVESIPTQNSAGG